jgi:acyl dehydratase
LLGHRPVSHSVVNYRGPALVGDITITTGSVTDKLIDDQGRNLVQVESRMANQLDATVATAKAEILLPARG